MKTKLEQNTAFDALFNAHNPYAPLEMRQVREKIAADKKMFWTYWGIAFVAMLILASISLFFGKPPIVALIPVPILGLARTVNSLKYQLSSEESRMLGLYEEALYYYEKAMKMVPTEMWESDMIQSKDAEGVLVSIAIATAQIMKTGIAGVEELKGDVYENCRTLLRTIAEVVVRLGLAGTKNIKGDDRVYKKRAEAFYQMVYDIVKRSLGGIVVVFGLHPDDESGGGKEAEAEPSASA